MQRQSLVKSDFQKEMMKPHNRKLARNRAKLPKKIWKTATTIAVTTIIAQAQSFAISAVSSVLVLLAHIEVKAQSAEDIAKTAQAITVRIEGATQGSGVIVKRSGNRYTVLTAWHVLAGQKPQEELAIYTPDGIEYQGEKGSIKKLGEADLATITFSSTRAYTSAIIANIESIFSGSKVFISGFPLPTPAVPARIWRFLEGSVTSLTTTEIPQGYQLLYSASTLTGMSGGPILNNKGRLVGIHGRSETDTVLSEQIGVAVRTGIRQGIPISYYERISGNPRSSPGTTNTFNSSQQATMEARDTGVASSMITGNSVLTSNGFALAVPQAPSRPASSSTPTRSATDRDVNVYNQMGAINICVQATKQVGLDKSLPANLEMIVSTLNFVHGGIIQGANNNKKLEANQLANGTIFGVVPRIKQMCYDKFTATDKKTVDDLMAQIQKALQGQPGGGK